jgi:hypothetical protein
MAKHGFRTVFCEPMNLRRIQQELNDWWGGRLWETFLKAIDTRSHFESLWALCKRILGRTGAGDGRIASTTAGSKGREPHLVYVGRRAD